MEANSGTRNGPRSIPKLLRPLLGIALLLMAATIASPGATPDHNLLQQLISRGEEFRRRLETNAATWDVHLTSADGGSIGSVLVRRDRDRTQWVGYARDIDGKRKATFRVTESDGVWYVDDTEGRIRCRPWEHFFTFPFADALIEASEPMVLQSTEGISDRGVTQDTNGFVTLRLDEDPALSRRLMRSMSTFKDFKELSRQKPGAQPNSSTRTKPELGKPDTLRVKASEGFLAARTAWKFRIEIRDFAWLPRKATNYIAVRTENRTDRTAPYLGVDWSRCVLVSHDPRAEPGDRPRINPRLGILRLDTGVITRVPIPSFGALWGCFLGNRTKVLCTVMPLAGDSALQEVDLIAGTTCGWSLDNETRPVGMPVPSPDASRIALLCSAPDGETVLDMQMLLIQPGSESAEWIGEPGRWGGPYSWFPDSRQIALKRFLHAPADKIEPRMICTMDLDGKSRDLRSGDDVLVLPRRNELLIRDSERVWWTTDLEGKNPKRYADGMRAWGSPALSPDGTEILWVRFDPKEIPTLHRFPYGSSDGTPATHASGFVSIPVW